MARLLGVVEVNDRTAGLVHEDMRLTAARNRRGKWEVNVPIGQLILDLRITAIQSHHPVIFHSFSGDGDCLLAGDAASTCTASKGKSQHYHCHPHQQPDSVFPFSHFQPPSLVLEPEGSILVSQNLSLHLLYHTPARSNVLPSRKSLATQAHRE